MSSPHARVFSNAHMGTVIGACEENPNQKVTNPLWGWVIIRYWHSSETILWLELYKWHNKHVCQWRWSDRHNRLMQCTFSVCLGSFMSTRKHEHQPPVIKIQWWCSDTRRGRRRLHYKRNTAHWDDSKHGHHTWSERAPRDSIWKDKL